MLKSLLGSTAPALLSSCVIHVHVHEDAGTPVVAVESAAPKSVGNTASSSIRGQIVDANGNPVHARVAIVQQYGSVSSWSDEQGQFSLQSDWSDHYVVHASTPEGLVAIQPVDAGSSGLRLVLQAGAKLKVDYAGAENVRCALFQGDDRFEDFTLRGPQDWQQVVVPVGEVRVRIYTGDTVHAERAISAARGADQTVEFKLGAS
jgi:hypothetical protein